MMRFALLLIASTMVFGLATFGPFVFLAVCVGLGVWAAWSSRTRK